MTGDVLTAEHIKEMWRTFNNLGEREQQERMICSATWGGPLVGIPFIESDKMLEEEVYEEEVALTFQQRWVVPMLHPATVPFQPWVKTKTVKKTRMVPSRNLVRTPIGIICHPVMRAEISRVLSVEGVA